MLFKSKIFCYNREVPIRGSNLYGVWRSLVARSAGGREVAGSNPVTPIFPLFYGISGDPDIKKLVGFDWDYSTLE